MAVASFCPLIPWFHYGIPSGHDFEFHFNSWVEVLDHWKQGVIYPHWAAWAHYGYGEARFIFYPPVSWTLGGVLGAILPWKLVPGAFVWLALVCAGLSMFVLARNWLSPRSALFAAIFYALNPYHLIIVYWRSALAELIAAAYLPLLLLCVLRLEEDGHRIIAPLAMLLAAGWLTNVPSAVMMHYSLGVLVVWIAISRRRWNVLASAAVAVLAGAALAGVYLLPVWHQRGWVNLDQVLSPGVRPLDNFLFAHTSDADHDQFNRLISVVAVCEFALLGAAFLLRRAKQLKQLWRPLLLWGLVSVLLMLPFTSPLWNHLPELRYVQFPWRWLLALNLALALAITVAIRSWWLRVAVCALALAPVLIGAQRILAPWWDTAADIREMVDNQHDAIGDEGVDEYAPAGADPYDVDQNAPLAKAEGTASARITIKHWDAEHRVITANATSTASLALRLFDYPRWRVRVNGGLMHAETGPPGEMLVPLAPGQNRIEIEFVEGWDRTTGAVISFLTLLLLVAWHALCTKSAPPFAKADG